MEVRVITLKYNDEIGGFPEARLKAAVEDRRVLQISSHFFICENTPQMCVVLLLDDALKSGRKAIPKTPPKVLADPVAELSEDEKKIFAALRIWRLEVDRNVRMPNYCIAHNKHLARIAKMKPKTIGELREVAKMSEKFCLSYGNQILSVVASAGIESEKPASDDNLR